MTPERGEDRHGNRREAPTWAWKEGPKEAALLMEKSHISTGVFQGWLIFKRAKIDEKWCIISVVSGDYGSVMDSDQPHTNHSLSSSLRDPGMWLPAPAWLLAANLLD